MLRNARLAGESVVNSFLSRISLPREILQRRAASGGIFHWGRCEASYWGEIFIPWNASAYSTGAPRAIISLGPHAPCSTPPTSRPAQGRSSNLQPAVRPRLQLVQLASEKVIILWTLYIDLSRVYTPKGSIEKNNLIATKKRNLLLRSKLPITHNPNKEVSR